MKDLFRKSRLRNACQDKGELVKRLVLVAVLLPGSALAQFGEPRWDFSIGAIYQESVTSAGSNGSSIAMDSDLGFSLSFNYALNSRFSLGADLDFISPDYKAILVSDENPSDSFEVAHSADQFNGRIKGTFNFMEGPFVPYAQVGFGWTWFDSNVADGPPQTGCWWHPWWGYICTNYYRTYNSTEFTYGGALGLKYMLPGNRSFVNLSYDYWLLDTGGDRADPELSNWRLTYGWRF